MRHAISKYFRDFVALVVLVVIGLGVGGYILSNQRVQFPIIEEKPFKLKAEFSDAQAVRPGQGQTVRVAGMRIGDIGEVELVQGKAIVTMNLDQEFKDIVHEDATALLRPRTGLKDMFIALDPGSPESPVMEENDVLPVAQTKPDIDADEVLSALDVDTRAYLKLLINGAGKGLEGRGHDLRQVFRRFGPLNRDIARLTGQVKLRKRNLARLIHNYGSTVERLGEEDESLTQLVSSAGQVFERLSKEDENISLAVSRLPSALRETEGTLRKVDTLGQVAKPAFTKLRPAIRQLDKTNEQVEPFAREAAPIIKNQIRPFVRAARPYIADLKPTAQNLAKASPDLRESFFELNRFFNMAAYNVGGKGPAGSDEGYLFWLAWVAQNTNSLFNTADAMGPYRRIVTVASCTNLIAATQPGGSVPEVFQQVALGLINLVGPTGVCGSK
ncbi:MAG: MCE family protein [Thermoleophilaceae bacterium]|nr:MCE family protein [Thermoleophilaceae bacterium]